MKKFGWLVIMLVFIPSMAFALDMNSMTDDDLFALIREIEVELSTRQIENSDKTGVLLGGNVGSYYMSLTGIHMSSDRNENPVLVMDLTFTNNSTETKTASTTMGVTVFQGGIQCETTATPSDLEKSNLKLRPGASISFSRGAVLYNTEDPVEIEMDQQFYFATESTAIVGLFDLPQ